MGLNERQIKAVLYVKEKEKITNKEHQMVNDCSKATATKDIMELVNRGSLIAWGTGKRDLHYILSQKRAKKWVRREMKINDKRYIEESFPIKKVSKILAKEVIIWQ